MPRLLLIVLTVVTLASLGRNTVAETVFDTHRRVEIARLKLLLYQQVEHPSEVRRLQSSLKVADAEVASLSRLSKHYRSFNKFSSGNPLVLTAESTRLSLLRSQLNRDNLKADLTAVQRFHADRLRLLQLELEDARTRR